MRMQDAAGSRRQMGELPGFPAREIHDPQVIIYACSWIRKIICHFRQCTAKIVLRFKSNEASRGIPGRVAVMLAEFRMVTSQTTLVRPVRPHHPDFEIAASIE